MTLHPNRRRGEIAADFDGEPRLLCLTLGALAELESGFGVANLTELAGRFEAGLSAGDIIRIVGAGLRGAGNRLSDDDVSVMSVEGGAAGFARIATELLWLSFGAAGPGEGISTEVSDREGRRPDRRQNPPVPQAATR